MKKIFYIVLVLAGFNLSGQTISPQVINSAGQTYSNGINGVYVTDNIGEPFTQAIGGNFIVTQGFLQPDIVSIVGSTFSIIKNDVSCKDKSDGNISVSVSNILPGYQVKYNWTPSSVCPSSNCSGIDSLTPGTYTVQVIVTHTITGGTQSDSLKPAVVSINDLNGPCRIKIYSLVTPNGDNENDAFQIDNITDFPSNHVAIFNRWGQEVFETNGYDNVTKFWPAKEDVNKLAATTYFYIVNLGDGTKPIKGWVELIKN